MLRASEVFEVIIFNIYEKAQTLVKDVKILYLKAKNPIKENTFSI